MLARTNLAITRRRAARLAGVSPSTQVRVELGDPSVTIAKACQVAAAVGLKAWAKAFPVRTPSLRDTGQLRVADMLRRSAHGSFRVAIELPIATGRSADAVLFGPDEIVHVEIERIVADLQAQYRSSAAKREELASAHQRPVRLVLVIEDTRRNRESIRPHIALARTMLPAGSREVMGALRSGRALGRDGLLWIRPRNDRRIDRS